MKEIHEVECDSCQGIFNRIKRDLHGDDIVTIGMIMEEESSKLGEVANCVDSDVDSKHEAASLLVSDIND